MKVTVIAQILAKEGKEDATRQELMGLLEPTRAEKGCINYDLHQAMDNKALFIFYENWESKEDLEQHLGTPHLRDFLTKTEDLLAQPVAITLLEKIG